MPATIRTTASGFDRLKLALIVAGLLVTTLASVAAWLLNHDSTTASTSPAAERVVVHHPIDRPFAGASSPDATATPLMLDDFWRARIAGLSSAPPTAMQQYYAAKDARQEMLDLEATALAARAVQQEKLQQFYTRKEAQMDAFDHPQVAIPSRHVPTDRGSAMRWP